jgi:DNA helicase-2/ATP-dependent DNA helicase PcrA
MHILKENTQKLDDEKQIQDKLNNAIDKKNDFVFDAGAGSGKTYALIESLKYIIKTYGEKLTKKNQNVLCITYTNAAADNIKLNFGNSEIVKVSTIHERIWELICSHQDALVIEHEKKVNFELTRLKDKFRNSAEETWLKINSSPENIEKFVIYVLKPEIKNLFYTSTNHASDFKVGLEECGYDLKSSLGKFRESFKYIHNTVRLERCLDLIKSGEYKEVKYKANFNSDKLHYMTISHDTLLEYGLALCQKYPMLRRIIIDSYPYILIDEYQDTHLDVINLMSELSKDNSSSQGVLIGYYGDKMQSIYDKGVSNRLHEYHLGLLCIEKKYNRRSRDEIINVSDKLRNDGLLQESIYDNNAGGSFSFHRLVNPRPNDSSQLINEFILNQFSNNVGEEVHCLVLRNEMLAELSGFKSFYATFKDFFFHKDIKDKLISKDLNKLDNTIRIIFSLLDFREKIAKKNKTLEDLLPKEKMDISMFNAQKYVSDIGILVSEEVKTFEDYLNRVFALFHQEDSDIYKSKLQEFFPSSEFDYSLKGFCRLLNKELPTTNSIKDEERIDKINKVLNLDLTDYQIWYEFVNDSSNDAIKFHTYHSTKGLEYHNIVIIMENKFAKKNNYFPDLFKEPNNVDFQERRNLLYVACSRAICNMKILYLDPIVSFEDDIKPFFGEAQDFNMTDTGVIKCDLE